MDEKKKQELIDKLNSFIRQETDRVRLQELEDKLIQIQSFTPQKEQENK